MRILILLLISLQGFGQLLPVVNSRSRVPQGGMPPITYDTIAVRFTNSGSIQGGNWNNFIPATSLTWSDLINLSTGSATTVDLSLAAYSSTGNTSMSGICTDPSAAGFPLSISNRTVTKTTAGDMSFTLSGIPTGKKVDLVYYVGLNGVSHSLSISSQSKTDTIEEIDQNCSDVAKITDLTESSGSLTFTVGSSTSVKRLQGLYIILHD